MKITKNAGSVWLAKSLLALTVLFTSCEKNNIDATGAIDLKVVNAGPVSTPQSFYLAGTALVNGGLAFTNASGYIKTVSGTRLVAEYRNDSTGSTYAEGELWVGDGKSYTVFLAGGNGSERVKVFEDDLSAPASGKVRVRFIHLSDDAPSDIKIEDSAGNDLVTNVSRNIASGYKTVNPGTLSIRVYGTALNGNVGNYEFSDLLAGKVYTVYLAGVSSTGTTAHLIVHN
ncbi:DUF4397 domain-containing protein [Chitinophaga sp.]|uniref:DUF4397 domain-containing protein n=1 Tax=Chitinophaga sp. TaxID=1869181 RepID=UPI0031CDFF30